MHLHVHVIPRYRGDMDDPRGGVRGVIPSKQKYEAPSAFDQLPPFVHGSELHLEASLRQALVEADRADMLSAFVQVSGVKLLLDDLRDALRRGVTVRLLAGDYLGISSPDALRMLLRLSEEHENFRPYFFETGGTVPFHPKSYIFRRGDRGVAYIGSSNLSGSALTHGVEWNLRLVSSSDANTFSAICRRFELLLNSSESKPLTRELVEAYEARAPELQATQRELRDPPPSPTPIQDEALRALRATRRDGHNKGLVVLATGLGKTYLSAFDFKNVGGERALFVAHRDEILGQAADSWQKVFPDKTALVYDGTKKERDADILFASVQTLSRVRHLSKFPAEYFDYIVIDEFHHAAAATYRKILGHFRPRFLLGLTATPERMDGRSLLELCGDNLVYRRDIVHGVSQRLLVPFHYFGVKDTTNFEPIPWRSGRFDAEELTKAVATEERAAQALREYEQRAAAGPRRTLCFCCTTVHADYMADFFRRNGKRAVAVHSDATSAPRAQSLRDLRDGGVEIICAVDIFNEGLDVPDINTVVMLRPTESPVIFLQQLGRGLRRAENKERLTVVDFIGNHRSFLVKPQSLLFLLGQDVPPMVALQKIQEQTLPLPEGCHIEIETTAIDLLRSLVQPNRQDILVYEYMNFRDAHARRPSAGELFDAGVSFEPIKKGAESWFSFVDVQGDLTSDEKRVLQRHSAWFRDLLVTKMVKSYKMLALRALVDADALFSGMDAEENARRAFESVRDDLLLFREMREDEDRRAFGAGFVRKWVEMPLVVWARGESTSQVWFRMDGDRFAPTFDVAQEDRDVFEAMTEEMAELRLRQHRDRLLRGATVDATIAPIVLKVSHSSKRPILRFDRERRPDVPLGPTFVNVDGDDYSFDFKKIAVNVATREGGGENVLPMLLRRWLGPMAGQPGTRHEVELVRDGDEWRLLREAADARVVEATEVSPFPALPFFPDVAAACGSLLTATGARDKPMETIRVRKVDVDPARQFVVRAEGDSMDGGETPIADGDLVLCQWLGATSAEQVEGHATLLVGRDASFKNVIAAIKVPRRRDGRWLLESWNPSVAPQGVPADVKLEPIARVLGVVDDTTGLALWGEYDRDVIAVAFGSKNDPSWRVGHRDVDVAGQPHTVLMVTLRKRDQKKIEHRYADRFLSRTEMQWESQASTRLDHQKGQRIVNHLADQRTIHLFVQYDSHQKFTYLGPVRYQGHEGEAPMRVRLELDQALPETLWRLWA
jgi:superfamily II DNA or RNA helicase